MKIIRQYLIVAILFNIPLILSSQVVSGLSYNPAIKAYKEQAGRFKSTKSQKLFTPPLPDANHYFFDDFYYAGRTIFPNPELWQDKNVFINTTYGDSLISIGMATLDAIDANGDIYAVDDRPTPSDTLTSQRIDISGATDNLYFSFFIQGGGKGNAPEQADSITLEFYHKDSLHWDVAWSLKGMESHTFKQYIIPVGDSLRSDEFMFRFSNFTSLNEKSAPGGDESALSNADMWHLDYIELQKADNEDAVRAINDVAFVKPMDPTHTEYYSLPWEHLKYSNGGRRGTVQMVIETEFPERVNDIELDRTAVSYNIYKGQHKEIGDFFVIANAQPPEEYVTYSEVYNSQYEYLPNQKYGHFLRTAYFKPEDGVDQYLYNDTTVLEEKFTDYYAYDDGSAEYGFGFPGNGGIYLQFAQLYTFFNMPNGPKDTLTAVDYYFTKARNNAHGNMEFSVCVWSYEEDGNGHSYPGEILYPHGNISDWPTYFPDTTLGYNEFMRVNLEEDLIVPDTVFVGFVQFGTDFISLGYDINTNNKSKMRYNDGNGWSTPKNSLRDGTVMIRPVFDHKVFTKVRNTEISSRELTLYPNPAQDYLNLEIPEYTGSPGNYELTIFDILGKTIFKSYFLEQVDVSNMEPGLYFISLYDKVSQISYTQKFLKKD
jgi:hypothetical protein